MRKLTLTVEADQPEADWIWEALKDREQRHGLKIIGVADGDLVGDLEAELDDLHDKIAMLPAWFD